MLKHPKRVFRPLFKSLNLFSYEKSGKVRKNFRPKNLGVGIWVKDCNGTSKVGFHAVTYWGYVFCVQSNRKHLKMWRQVTTLARNLLTPPHLVLRHRKIEKTWNLFRSIRNLLKFKKSISLILYEVYFCLSQKIFSPWRYLFLWRLRYLHFYISDLGNPEHDLRCGNDGISLYNSLARVL